MGTRTTARDLSAGLRSLADFIDANPDLPWGQTYAPKIEVYPVTADATAEFASVAGGWQKRPAGRNGELMDLHREFGPIVLSVIVARDQVCERKVVGVETVEECKPLLKAGV